MAFDAKPNTWIANWSEDATNITIPLASFPKMTAAEADATSGDIRKVLFAIADKLYDTWANTDAADRPAKMVLTKTKAVDVATNLVTSIFTFRFTTEISEEEVVAES